MGQVLRLLIIVIAIWVVFRLVQHILRPRPSAAKSPPGAPSPRMLACVVCGVHVPESRAVIYAGKTYCSKEHLPPPS